MNGYGSHAYMWVNAAGEKYWVKYHFHTEQGMAFFSNAEAADMAGSDADCHRRDLFEAIARGDHPSWRVSVQVRPYDRKSVVEGKSVSVRVDLGGGRSLKKKKKDKKKEIKKK